VDSADKWPFFLLINGRTCSAILIGQHFALTTAQCCEATSVRYVHFGKDGMLNTFLSGIYTDGVTVHPNFDSSTFENDYCVIHFVTEVVYGPKVAPICFAPELPEIGHNLWTAGFGATSNSATTPEAQLKEVMTPLRNQSTCDEHFKISPATMACTGSLIKKESACKERSFKISYIWIVLITFPSKSAS
jgi:hypothetical protein